MSNVQAPLAGEPQSEKKYVFAHLIVGVTHPYTVEDWVADIELASANDIDGFALNVGPEDWVKDCVSMCFEAMSRTKVPFKSFFSFDMAAIQGNKEEDVQILRHYMESFANHPNMHRQNGKVVVSTFAGENSSFGFDPSVSLDQRWSFVKKMLKEIAPIEFIPSFFIDPARYPEISSLDGIFNFNGGWPLQLDPSMSTFEIESAKLETDQDQLRNLGGRKLMTAVSPWFFTHYGPSTFGGKNWIYRADDWLFVRRWEQLIANRAQISIVQVVSWNDFGESHYIGPIKGAQPLSQLWVDGFPHDGWLRLNKYYARAFKDGIFPTIKKDVIYLWGRPHPKEAQAPDKVDKPKNWQLTDNIFWVVVFSTAPATVTLFTKSGSNEKSIDVQAGVTKLSRPLKVGEGMGARMKRAGKVTAECIPVGFQFRGKPSVYNFNAFVAMSK